MSATRNIPEFPVLTQAEKTMPHQMLNQLPKVCIFCLISNPARYFFKSYAKNGYFWTKLLKHCLIGVPVLRQTPCASYCKMDKIAKILNAAKVYAGYCISAICGRPVVFGKPVAASIEPANFCNLHCPHCPTGAGMLHKDRKLLDMETFSRILSGLLPELAYLNLYFQGEPFLNRMLPDMVDLASRNGVFTCISTNGQFMDAELARKLKDAGLGKLIVSVDGADEQSYSQYRIGGSFAKAVECLKTAAGAGLPVELQCLLLSSTENGTDKVKELARNCGVKKTTFKTAQLYSDKLRPSNNRYSRYIKEKNGNLRLKHKLRNRCLRLWTTAVVDVNGNVLPCCFDKTGKYPYGNMLVEDFKEIWFSDKANGFRLQILQNRKSVDICRNCSE